MEVYRIYNKINGKSYIGVTKKTFKVRYLNNWVKHTHNNHLKKSAKRYGEENFDYEILIDGVEDFDELMELEKKYIKEFNSFVPNGYNLTYGGSSKNPSHCKEYKLIDHFGITHNIKNLSQFSEDNGLNYSAMLNLVSGINKTSQGYALFGFNYIKIKNPKQVFKVKNSLTNQLFHINDCEINQFCLDNGLLSQTFRNILRGSSKTCGKNGEWSLDQTDVSELRHARNRRKYKNIELVSPEGRIIIIENVYNFCKEYNISRSSFYDMINEKTFECCGWKLPKYKDDKIRKEARLNILGKKFNVISPEGELIEIQNMSYFCRKYNLKQNSMYYLVSGKNKSNNYNGWKRYEE
jgi:hypothetical protein